jgi:hypothetical protein
MKLFIHMYILLIEKEKLKIPLKNIISFLKSTCKINMEWVQVKFTWAMYRHRWVSPSSPFAKRTTSDCFFVYKRTNDSFRSQDEQTVKGSRKKSPELLFSV